MRISDWSSDVCSSDLAAPDFEILHDPLANNGDDGAYRYRPPLSRHGHQEQRLHLHFREYRREADSGLLDPAGAISVHQDRKSVVKGRSVSVRVDLGGRQIIKNKKQRIHKYRDS